ncbi:hypothetical protein ARMA_0571 [Ardenticatena maritima]|uniref:HMA domain-containing protein n=1 Tax=Ardenticatena maritima TaxID=872965 RepID=A0A0M9UBR4_9CHLR|nr:cation-translocating P-type ATPase [Ardenticatena maritima]KPL87671.1 hypothetical protein SE16_08665 [Ardenticatena maritima]GAP62148.1 hypothetical protein ARMA_0571 [Ardenticatena maritima]
MVTCELCGLPARHPLHDEHGRTFCCPSCRDVAALLAEPVDSTASPAPSAETPLAESTLYLGGLWCTSCTWLIGETLRRTPGVVEADISFARRQARVRFDPRRLSPQSLVKRVRRLGYRVGLAPDELRDEAEALLERLLIAGVFVMHIMLLSGMLYVREIMGWNAPETRWLEDFFRLMIFVASIPVLPLLGWPVLRSGLAGILSRQPNMHALIALGTSAAYILSLRNLITGNPHVYFDTAAMLLFLVTIGRWLEVRTQESGLEAIEHLQRHMPTHAAHITPNGVQEISVDDIQPGMRLLIRPGERFPADGIVAEGQGAVDESLLTGEPVPRTHASGDTVYAGTLNLDGVFEIIVTASGGATAVGQMSRLIHEALWTRAPVQRLADRFAALLVPFAVFLSVGTFLYWTTIASSEVALMHALSVLLIACPCALGIATPLALWRGISTAAEHGVLIRETSVLERLANAEVVLFDKTGTLTETEPSVYDMVCDQADPHTVQERLVALESRASHPFARAICRAFIVEKPPTVEGIQVLAGQGLGGRINDEMVWVGSAALMASQGLAYPPRLAEYAARWADSSLALVFIGWGGLVRGIVALTEQLRPDVPSTLQALHALGIHMQILSGDPQAHQRWGETLGVPLHAGLTPDEKVSYLQQYNGVVMIGDGVNDGPALATADVGITLGQATDLAHATADVILLNNRLESIVPLLLLARQTMRIIRQNLAWAFFYNALGLGLAVTGRLHPLWAALAMVLSSLIVTGNALRLHWPHAANTPSRQIPLPLRRKRRRAEQRALDTVFCYHNTQADV